MRLSVCMYSGQAVDKSCINNPAGDDWTNSCYQLQKPGTAWYSKSIDFTAYEIFREAVPLLPVNNYAWRITGNFTHALTNHTHTTHWCIMGNIHHIYICILVPLT